MRSQSESGRRRLGSRRPPPPHSSGATSGGWSRVEVSDGLLLRAVVVNDAEAVLSHHGDPRVYRFDPQETHPDVAFSRRFIVPMVEHWERHGFGYWSVLVPHSWWQTGVAGAESSDDGRVHAGLGGVQRHVVAGEPVLNVYFRLATAVHGRGIAGLLLNEAVRMAPHVAPGIDLVVRTRPANSAARQVAERAGFVDEGMEPGTSDMQLLRLTAPRSGNIRAETTGLTSACDRTESEC